ncbi:MAG TPA: redox-regulated ATPase YchF [Thermoprotei archaeon]|nr:redox-regulated ATPase YchF [Thermoprotei archaeon]
MYQIGIVGKPNTGKSTFFSAATLIEVKIASYPFTTIDSNRGISYVSIPCVCKEMGVKDNPRNSRCINGIRFIPIELIDVAGLVPDAWKGRGLGNRFLDELRQASVLIHVVDASGSTDIEGRKVKPGSHYPGEDILFLEREIDMWIFNILKREWKSISRRFEKDKVNILSQKLSGLGVTEIDIENALKDTGLESKRFSEWSDDNLMSFVKNVRHLSKPIVIAANKIDVPIAEEYVKRLKEDFKNYVIIPISALAELILRKAAENRLIKYIPGSSDFEILDEKKIDSKQLNILEYIRENVLKKWGSTGVQEVLNKALFDVLGVIAVFPVEDENRLTDHDGNILPDVFLVPKGTTVRELAYKIHTELGEKFIAGIDVRRKRRISADYILTHRAIIKIVARK